MALSYATPSKTTNALQPNQAPTTADHPLQSALQELSFDEQEALLQPDENAAYSAAPSTYVLGRGDRATDSHIISFRAQLRRIAQTWGQKFEIEDMVASKENGENVLTLHWPDRWGPAPSTTEMPVSLSPIEAKLALYAFSSLPGWSELSSSEQSQLEALIGGETNTLSIQARRYFSHQVSNLKEADTEAQKNAFIAALSAPEAILTLVDEDSTMAASEPTVSTPQEVDDFPFRGDSGPALIYDVSYDDGTAIQVIAPQTKDEELFYHTVEEVISAANALLTGSRRVIKQVVLNPSQNPDDAYWAVQYNTPNFRSYMTAGAAGIVHIYPMDLGRPDMRSMRGSLIHETGHTWSFQTWGNDTTKGGWIKWKKAMDSDGLHVSRYAQNSISEDVAETIRAYQGTQGQPQFEEYRQMLPARFAILDKEFV